MSSLALGNPTVAYAYKYDAKGSAFNKLFYNILSPGIYNGGGLSFSGNQIIVNAYDALFPYPTSSQIIAVHTNSSINLSSSVESGGYGLGNITSSLPYIAMYFIWTDSQGVYPDYGFYDVSVTTNASYVILGKATFTGSSVSGFDYSVSTYPPRYNPTTRGLNVRGLTDSTSTSTGSVVINGGVGIAKSLKVGYSITTPQLSVGNTYIWDDANNTSIELGNNKVGDGYSLIDFHARASSDYDARIARWGGINGNFDITNAGTGDINIVNSQGQVAVQSKTSLYVQSLNTGNTMTIEGHRLYTNNNTNFHIDPSGPGATYLNYYGGTGGINFCNGAGVVSAQISAGGAIFSLNVTGGASIGVYNTDLDQKTYLYSNSNGRGLWDSYTGDIIGRSWSDSAWTFYGNLTGNAATATTAGSATTAASCTGNAATADNGGFPNGSARYAVNVDVVYCPSKNGYLVLTFEGINHENSVVTGPTSNNLYCLLYKTGVTGWQTNDSCVIPIKRNTYYKYSGTTATSAYFYPAD